MQNTFRLSQEAKQLEDDSSNGDSKSNPGGGGEEVNYIFFTPSTPLLVKALENDNISVIVTQLSSEQGYIAEMCEAHLHSMETVKQNGGFTLFSS